MRLALSLTVAILMVGSFAWASNNNSNVAAKKTVKEVMNAGMAGDNSLFKKVAGGSASAEEKAKLLDLLIDLLENDAPKGDTVEWKMASGTAMVAAAKLVIGREGALDELKAAANCKACHDKFKGK